MVHKEKETSDTEEEMLQFSVLEGLATIRLNRPAKLNSVDARMFSRLMAVLDRIDRDETVRAVYLTGNGRAFCSGQDLGERKRPPDAAPLDLSRTIEAKWNPLARTLHYLRVPVVCGVNGVAAGAGVSLALHCDVVFAARSAKFILSFARMGMVPDTGLTWLLPRLIGSARAMGLALSGGPLAATRAEQWGLIWRCVDDGELDAAARGFAEGLAKGPTLGLSIIKRALWQSPDNAFEAQVEFERRAQRDCGFSNDYREAVAAFMEKRTPIYEGH